MASAAGARSSDRRGPARPKSKPYARGRRECGCNDDPILGKDDADDEDAGRDTDQAEGASNRARGPLVAAITQHEQITTSSFDRKVIETPCGRVSATGASC